MLIGRCRGRKCRRNSCEQVCGRVYVICALFSHHSFTTTPHGLTCVLIGHMNSTPDSSWKHYFFRLCVVVADPDESFYWCQRHKLLPESMACPKCTRDMHLVTRDGSHGAEGMVWRCPRNGCRKEVSLRSCTFFEGKL